MGRADGVAADDLALRCGGQCAAHDVTTVLLIYIKVNNSFNEEINKYTFAQKSHIYDALAQKSYIYDALTQKSVLECPL